MVDMKVTELFAYFALGAVVVDKTLNENTPQIGFDAATGKVVNLVETGVIDPTKV